jgi:hypothetical protein
MTERWGFKSQQGIWYTLVYTRYVGYLGAAVSLKVARQEGLASARNIASKCFEKKVSSVPHFFNCHPKPWRDSTSRPIDPVSSIPLDHAARARCIIFYITILYIGTYGQIRSYDPDTYAQAPGPSGPPGPPGPPGLALNLLPRFFVAGLPKITFVSHFNWPVFIAETSSSSMDPHPGFAWVERLGHQSGPLTMDPELRKENLG